MKHMPAEGTKNSASSGPGISNMAELHQPSLSWGCFKCPSNPSIEPDDRKYVVLQHQRPFEIALDHYSIDGAMRFRAGLPRKGFGYQALSDQLL